ncbi:hypothetical protein DAEQUDRAFT_653968, partial [Daedalea quercina L-15889]
STRRSMDDHSPFSKGQLSMELAAALGMQTMPLSSYQTLAGLDTFTPASYHATRHSISGYPPSAYHYQNDQQADSYIPSALSGSNLALHDALANAFLSAQLHQQRPPSPQLHYPLRWPEADSYPQYSMPNQVEPALAQGAPVFSQSYSVAPQSTYQSLQDAHTAASQPAWSVSGSLDPVTGVFQRMPEHPRLRTAQACEKCRTRKAKCSGEHPSCQRCRSRGLLCEYAPERRMRGPNKKKREGHSVDSRSPVADEQRRGSIISITSTSSGTSDLDAYRFPDVPPPVQASAAMSRPASRASLPHVNSPHPPSPRRQPSRSQDYPAGTSSPLRFRVGDAASAMSPPPPPAPTSVRGGRPRPRPPPLHLGDAAFFDASAFMQQHTPATPSPLPMPHSAVELVDDITPTYAARRQSLPAYLLHGFTPTPPVFAQHSDDTHSRSNSTSTAPTTPLTGSESELDASAELGYPDD